MQVIYAGEKTPENFKKSIYLIGPTPRSQDVVSWRPKMIEVLRGVGYDGLIFVPEPEDVKWPGYMGQIDWEQTHLNMSDLILAWVPRNLQVSAWVPRGVEFIGASEPGMESLGLTTNIETGMYLDSGKLLYGRPEWAAHCGYLDYTYKKKTGRNPCTEMKELAEEATSILKMGASRVGGERCVPLHIWKTKYFQDWLSSQKSVGNRLDAARLLWNYIPKKGFVFCYAMWVKVWIESEQRYKENELIISRSDISCICAYDPHWEHESPLRTEILLVREFRSPVCSKDGFVHELPGGSAFGGSDPLELAAHELEEETGIRIAPQRMRRVNCRQINATLSTHRATLFAVELTREEMKAAKMNTEAHGVTKDSERTYVEVKTLKEIIENNLVDWSMMGMILEAIRGQ